MNNRAIFGAGNKIPLLLHFIQQDFPTGVTIIDPDGSLARAAADIVPVADTQRAFYFDPANHPASFNVFENVKDTAKLVSDICAFFDAMFPAGETTLTRSNSNFVLRTALTAVSDNRGATFMSVLEFLTDGQFREDCLASCTNPMARVNWDIVESWETSQRTAAFGQVQIKLGTLLLSPVMYDTLQKKCTHFFENNEILIADLSRSKIGDHAARLLGTLLISRAKTPVYINDFQFFASDYLTSLLSQGGYTVTLPFLSTVPPNVAQELLGFQEQYVFKTTPEDADRLKFSVGLMERRSLIELGDSEFAPAFDLEPPRTTGRAGAVLRRSVACYTRPKR